MARSRRNAHKKNSPTPHTEDGGLAPASQTIITTTDITTTTEQSSKVQIATAEAASLENSARSPAELTPVSGGEGDGSSSFSPPPAPASLDDGNDEVMVVERDALMVEKENTVAVVIDASQTTQNSKEENEADAQFQTPLPTTVAADGAVTTSEQEEEEVVAETKEAAAADTPVPPSAPSKPPSALRPETMRKVKTVRVHFNLSHEDKKNKPSGSAPLLSSPPPPPQQKETKAETTATNELKDTKIKTPHNTRLRGYMRMVMVRVMLTVLGVALGYLLPRHVRIPLLDW